MNFTYQPCPVRVHFGDPILFALKKSLPQNKETRLWIIATTRFQSLVEEISDMEGVIVAEHFSRVMQHVPRDQVQKARHSVAKLQPDILLSIGGGSATGLAKAIALKHPIPIWAVPTTYSGSEMTNIYGISSGGEKLTGRSPDVLPKTVFYDPDLSKNLPADLACTSSMNALAHLVEAVYSTENNPITYKSALHGIDILFGGMKEFSEAGELNDAIHHKFLLGSCIAGKSLCEVKMSLHHKAAHVLGGDFGMEHAPVHAVLLPYVFNYQWNSLDEKTKSDFRIAFGTHHPPLEVKKISEKMGAPITLKEIGFDSKDARTAASHILAFSFENPASMDQNRLTELFEQAYSGDLVIK